MNNLLDNMRSLKNRELKTVLVYQVLFFSLCLVNKSSASNRSHHQYYEYHADHANRIRPAAVKLLRMNEGDVCRDGQGLKPDFICVDEVKCKPSTEDNRSTDDLDVCSLDGSRPIICCPSSAIVAVRSKRAVESSIADTKCREYSQLPMSKAVVSSDQTPGEQYLAAVLLTLGGPRIAHHQEFPHMAMIGYGETAEEMDWRCAGSLISERWILTAAHCHKMGSLARWARLGDVDRSPIDAGQHKDYRIEHHEIHPNYKKSERYFDIGLFRLAENVEFSASIRPICINTDPSMDQTDYPAVNVWGKTFIGEQRYDILIRVPLRNIPTSTCNNMYNSIKVKDPKLTRGVDSDSMLCAGTFNVAQLVCTGDSGGALQVPHETLENAITQIGITSFGSFCGVRNTPGVYTKVSKYVKWIEKIVW